MRRQLIDSGRPVNPPKDKCKENHTYTLHSQTAEPKTKRNFQEQSEEKKEKKTNYLQVTTKTSVT